MTGTETTRTSVTPTSNPFVRPAAGAGAGIAVRSVARRRRHGTTFAPMAGAETWSRRDVLRRGAAGAAAAGSAALLAACGGSSGKAAPATSTTAGTRPPTTSTTAAGPPAAAEWRALAGSLGGPLVLPADAAYATDKLLYNQRFDGQQPAAVAYCTSPADVQRCLAFVGRHGLAVAARSGGHSYGGYSAPTGALVIDVTMMETVVADTADNSAVVGAGTRLVDVYNQLGAAGLCLPGGSCPTVGIAGITLGGGIGVFGRLYGLTCDNVASLQLVTADARVLTCSATENEDLYWACRGGGGGNFGVVTSFTFALRPIPPIALFTLVWPYSAAADVLGAWSEFMGSAPDELWSNCQLLSGGTSGLELRVTGVYAGSAAACSSALSPLLSAVGAAPSSNFVGPEAYLPAMLIEGGCEGDTVAQCHLPSQNPAGILSRATFAAKSAYLAAPLPAATLDAVVAGVETLANELPDLGGGMVFDAYGGAINRVAADATAFVHRDELCAIEYDVNWSPGASAATVAGATRWLDATQSTLAPVADGAYQNYIDPTLDGWLDAYYGANLDRLVRVKAAVDPDDVFHFAQSIPTRL